jgi:hypothetical protein
MTPDPGIHQQETTMTTDIIEARPAARSEPMALIELAVKQGADPDQLGKLMDLQERWDALQAAKAFAASMAAAQTEMPIVVKDGFNQSTNSRFAKKQTIEKAIKPIYLAHGLTVQLSEDPNPREGWITVKAVVSHVSGHIERHYRTGPIDNKGPKGNPTKSELHGCESTFNYLSRRLICGIFNVTESDQESDGDHGKGQNITEEQAITLADVLNQLPPERQQRFLGWLGVKTLYEVPADRFDDARKQLVSALNKMKAEGGK